MVIESGFRKDPIFSRVAHERAVKVARLTKREQYEVKPEEIELKSEDIRDWFLRGDGGSARKVLHKLLGVEYCHRAFKDLPFINSDLSRHDWSVTKTGEHVEQVFEEALQIAQTESFDMIQPVHLLTAYAKHCSTDPFFQNKVTVDSVAKAFTEYNA